DISNGTALQFVILLGLVSLFADMTYEWAPSITGPYLAVLGASACITRMEVLLQKMSEAIKGLSWILIYEAIMKRFDTRHLKGLDLVRAAPVIMELGQSTSIEDHH